MKPKANKFLILLKIATLCAFGFVISSQYIASDIKLILSQFFLFVILVYIASDSKTVVDADNSNSNTSTFLLFGLLLLPNTLIFIFLNGYLILILLFLQIIVSTCVYSFLAISKFSISEKHSSSIFYLIAATNFFLFAILLLIIVDVIQNIFLTPLDDGILKIFFITLLIASIGSFLISVLALLYTVEFPEFNVEEFQPLEIETTNPLKEFSVQIKNLIDSIIFTIHQLIRRAKEQVFIFFSTYTKVIDTSFEAFSSRLLILFFALLVPFLVKAISAPLIKYINDDYSVWKDIFLLVLFVILALFILRAIIINRYTNKIPEERKPTFIEEVIESFYVIFWKSAHGIIYISISGLLLWLINKVHAINGFKTAYLSILSIIILFLAGLISYFFYTPDLIKNEKKGKLVFAFWKWDETIKESLFLRSLSIFLPLVIILTLAAINLRSDPADEERKQEVITNDTTQSVSTITKGNDTDNLKDSDTSVVKDTLVNKNDSLDTVDSVKKTTEIKSTLPSIDASIYKPSVKKGYHKKELDPRHPSYYHGYDHRRVTLNPFFERPPPNYEYHPYGKWMCRLVLFTYEEEGVDIYVNERLYHVPTYDSTTDPGDNTNNTLRLNLPYGKVEVRSPQEANSTVYYISQDRYQAVRLVATAPDN